MQDKAPFALTSQLIQYLYENPSQAAIVGPYPNPHRVASAVAAFNRAKSREYTVKLYQHKVLMVDPEAKPSPVVVTMWVVLLKSAQSKQVKPRKPHVYKKKPGRPKKEANKDQ